MFAFSVPQPDASKALLAFTEAETVALFTPNTKERHGQFSVFRPTRD